MADSALVELLQGRTRSALDLVMDHLAIAVAFWNMSDVAQTQDRITRLLARLSYMRRLLDEGSVVEYYLLFGAWDITCATLRSCFGSDAPGIHAPAMRRKMFVSFRIVMDEAYSAYEQMTEIYRESRKPIQMPIHTFFENERANADVEISLAEGDVVRARET